MDKLSNKEIIKIIKEYVCSKHTNGAILINGDWGSGKTYFVKNKVKKTIETDCNKELVYLSLYGISSCDEIIKQLFIQTTPFKKIKNPQLIKGSVYAKSMLGAGLSFFGIDSDKLKLDYKKLLDIDKSKYLLVFDDLERCKIDIIEALGFINNFVEHDKIKTIIIANDKEISSQYLLNNYELKMLVASNTTSDNQETELDNKVKTMFSQNEAYKNYKEKVISQEIKYECNISDVLPELISSIVKNDKQTEEFLLENQDLLIEELNRREHLNLRTVIFILTLFEKLSFGIVNHFNSDCNKKIQEKILQDNFKSLICESVDFKNPPKENDDMKFWITRHYERFPYIISLVSTSIYKEEDLASLDNQYEKYQSSYSTIFELKSNWPLMNDSEIEEKTIKSREEILSNKHNFHTCFETIELLITLNKHNFHFDYNYIIEYINNRIDTSENAELQNITTAINMTYPLKPEDKYISIINNFKERIINKEDSSIANKLNSFLGKQNWGEQLFVYINDENIKHNLFK